MLGSVTYNCTALLGTNKAGKLKCDKSGYYKVVLGAFDFKNSVGENYPFRSAKNLFRSSSSLMRRVENGKCRGELGHPMRLPGMEYRDYMERVLRIEEKNVCVHIRSLTVDTNAIKSKDNKHVVAVLGDVKPSGPYGVSLESSIKNPDENVDFSLRSIVKKTFENGVVQKHLLALVTYDAVNEGGISVANKYNAPGLESLIDDYPITPAVLDEIEQNRYNSNISLELNNSDVEIIRTELGWSKVEVINIPSLSW